MSNVNLPLHGLVAAEGLGAPGEALLRRLTQPGAPRDAKALLRVAKDFESVLVHRLLDEMSSTISESGLLGDGTSKQVQSLFWSFLAREVSERGGVGLWKDLYKQWSGVSGPQADAAPPTMETSA